MCNPPSLSLEVYIQLFFFPFLFISFCYWSIYGIFNAGESFPLSFLRHIVCLCHLLSFVYRHKFPSPCHCVHSCSRVWFREVFSFFWNTLFYFFFLFCLLDCVYFQYFQVIVMFFFFKCSGFFLDLVELFLPLFLFVIISMAHFQLQIPFLYPGCRFLYYDFLYSFSTNILISCICKSCFIFLVTF